MSINKIWLLCFGAIIVSLALFVWVNAPGAQPIARECVAGLIQ